MICIDMPTLPAVEDYLDLVDRAVTKVSRRIPAFVDRDDLRSAALHALVRGINADATITRQQLWVRIHGAVLDELRGADTLTRTERRDCRLVQKTSEALAGTLSRHPLIPEIAAAAQLSCTRVQEVLSWEQKQEAVDLDALVDGSISPSEVAGEIDLQSALDRVLATLPDKQSATLRLFYLEGMNLSEVAAKLGVSVERARQLRVAGEKRLKADHAAMDLFHSISN